MFAATRYIGSATIKLYLQDDDSYSGTITVDSIICWTFEQLRQPAIYSHALDSAEAWDDAAQSAVGFATGLSSDEPDAPTREHRDAIEQATAYEQDDQGNYRVLRRHRRPATRKAPKRAAVRALLCTSEVA